MDKIIWIFKCETNIWSWDQSEAALRIVSPGRLQDDF